MAGLSAAQSLLVNGIQDITILEAAERYGGRIFTKQFGGASCELGTTCINESSVESSPTAHISYFQSSGKPINDKIRMLIMNEFERVQNELLKDTFIDVSLYDAFLTKIEQNLKELPKNQRSAAIRTYCGILNSMRLQYGTDLSNVNMKLCKKKFVQSLNEIPAAGCIESLKPIAEALPKNVLHLGVPVGKIEWLYTRTASNKPICVHGLCGRKFLADFVICTFPIGVLKALSTNIFDPPLPKCKINSIAAIGVGQVEKIFLQFTEPLNKWFRGPFKLAWSPRELRDRTHWNSGMCSVANVPNSERVLEVTVAGFQAEEMRLQSDDSVAEEIMKTLIKFQGN